MPSSCWVCLHFGWQLPVDFWAMFWTFQCFVIPEKLFWNHFSMLFTYSHLVFLVKSRFWVVVSVWSMGQQLLLSCGVCLHFGRQLPVDFWAMFWTFQGFNIPEKWFWSHFSMLFTYSNLVFPVKSRFWVVVRAWSMGCSRLT